MNNYRMEGGATCCAVEEEQQKSCEHYKPYDNQGDPALIRESAYYDLFCHYKGKRGDCFYHED